MSYSAFGYLGFHILLSVRSLSAPAARPLGTRYTPYDHLLATSLRPDPLDSYSTSFNSAIHSTYSIYLGGLLHFPLFLDLLRSPRSHPLSDPV